VELLEAEEGGAFGAALLAGPGVGAWASVEAACEATVRAAEIIGPRHAEVMAEAYGHYRRMYPALRRISEGAAQ
jgi:xylulokinase